MKKNQIPSLGIIDDHPASIFGLSAFFESIDDLEVKWTVSSIDELKAALEKDSVEVLVADFKIGDDQILEIVSDDLKAKVVIYSGFYLEENVREAFAHGIMAWIRKSDPLEELELAVRNALKGKKTIRATDEQFFKRDQFVDISNREREVLELIYEGKSNEEIGSALDMRVTTVKTHVSHLFSKLDAANRNEVVNVAISRGLLSTPDSTPPEVKA